MDIVNSDTPPTKPLAEQVKAMLAFEENPNLSELANWGRSLERARTKAADSLWAEVISFLENTHTPEGCIPCLLLAKLKAACGGGENV